MSSRQKPARSTKEVIYEMTRKAPDSTIRRPGTMAAAIYAALEKLKLAERSKIIDTVQKKRDLRTGRVIPEERIKWYLWQFEKDGLVRRVPDRRYRAKVA